MVISHGPPTPALRRQMNWIFPFAWISCEITRHEIVTPEMMLKVERFSTQHFRRD